MWNKVTQIAGILFLNSLPYLCMLWNYYCYPGYIVPFLNHPLARIVTMVLVLGQFAVMFLLILSKIMEPKLAGLNKLSRSPFVNIFIVLLTVTFILGPWLVSDLIWEPARQYLTTHPDADPALLQVYSQPFTTYMAERPGCSRIWLDQIISLAVVFATVIGSQFCLTRCPLKRT